MLGDPDGTDAATKEATKTATDPLTIDGETFEFDKLTYGERKQVSRLVKELVLHADPDADADEDWTADDVRLAFAIVCARRKTPGFSVEDGLKLTPAELEPGPPTRRRGRAA
jgi:hypothetical protein